MAKKEKDGEKKPFFKKAWFWVVVVILVLGVFGSGGESDSAAEPESGTDQQVQEQSQSNEDLVYTITGGSTLHGTVVTLNADTDMPVDKYLYKLPAGTYKVTTTNEKMAAFSIVKDEITIEEGNTEYPETLNYVSDQYLMTAGEDDFNGHAVKELTVTIGEDESISIPTDGDTFVFVGQ